MCCVDRPAMSATASRQGKQTLSCRGGVGALLWSGAVHLTAATSKQSHVLHEASHHALHFVVFVKIPGCQTGSTNIHITQALMGVRVIILLGCEDNVLCALPFPKIKGL